VFSSCANLDCGSPFVYGEGWFFRFHKKHASGEALPNKHSVQHFWLCARCRQEFTLEYSENSGVLLRNRSDVAFEAEFSRFVAAG
jgi:hypothetical protein